MAADWPAIKNEYMAWVDYASLSAKYGVREGTIRQRAHRDKWSDARGEMSRRVTEAALEKSTEDRAALLAQFNEDDIKVARALRAKAAQMLGDADSPSDMRALSGVFETAQRIGRLALGAETQSAMVTTKALPASVDEFV